MKQILQSLRDGTTELADVPSPAVRRGHVLIRTTVSLVSAGTERMLVDFGRANLLNKALQQPDKVRMALGKVRTDGLAATMDAVRSKLDQPLALGYCNVGEVIELGSGVEGLAIGDRVASNGKHAEIVCVPRNLCARIPNNVRDEQAAFTVVGAIGLQGIRLAGPSLGECVVVIGLGLIGLMTVQMLLAQGCRVMGVDIDDDRLTVAKQCGAEMVARATNPDEVAAAAQVFSRGRGVDAVIITAATKSNEPVRQAARMCRKRGRIVLVGVAGLELSRADFFEKELSFQVSCSYGPGRYDPDYEDGGQDYPIGFVRWTEQRNFEAVLDMAAAGSLDLARLVSHRFPLERAIDAYALLASGVPSLGILLDYPGSNRDIADLNCQELRLGSGQAVPHGRREPTSDETSTSTADSTDRSRLGPAHPVVGFLGAGNYGGRVLIPAFKAAGARLQSVVSREGVSAVHFGKKYGFERAATDVATVLGDGAISMVVVATRHDQHARQVIAALGAGKHVFCEKPLCLSTAELEEIEQQYRNVAAADSRSPILMVGFNRRFAPHIVKIRQLIEGLNEPKNFVMTVNAGAVPPDHWIHDKLVGGGRIIGEACHFIDLLRHLAGAHIESHSIALLGRRGSGYSSGENATITLRFSDGSMGTIHYFANGNNAFPKERLEVFCAGRVLQLDNFRRLRGWGWTGFSRQILWRQDKGQRACVRAFVEAVRTGGVAPIALDEVIEVSHASIEIATAAG
jgi:predicted dehydrogenase